MMQPKVATRVRMDANAKKERQDYEPLLPDMKKWLGNKGLSFFKEIKNEYGTVLATWMEYGIPHCVHFREGMQVRNKLRELTKDSWTSFEYDNTWAEIIEACLED